ncbi:heme-binding protein [Pseudomonadota bacterium]
MTSKLTRYSTCLAALLSISAIAAEEEQHLVTFQSMTTDTALKAAQATMASCRSKGYQVSVAVVDRGGNVQVLLRDRFAGSHTPETAIGKAATAVSFRTNTTELAEQVQSGEIPSGIQNISGVVMVGGGVGIEAAGSMIGGIGVSGAPGGQLDEDCANAGVEAILELIEF